MKKQKGFILAMILIFMVVLLFLGMGIAVLSFPEFLFLNRHAAYVAALHLADAGVKDALYRIQAGSTSNFSGSLTAGLPVNAPTMGSYQVAITPDPGNANDTYKMYQVVSTAALYSRPSVQRTVQAVVESTSFGRYVYFTDRERMAGYAGTRIWFKMGEIINGPAHSNDQFSINWNSYQGHDPIFTDLLTTASNFYWNPRAPETSAEWGYIFESGSSGCEMGVGNIPFPPSTTVQKTVCLAGISEPSSTCVTIPSAMSETTGGIFVKGNAKKMTFTVDAYDNQVIEIQQTVGYQTQKSTITINPTNNTTTWKKPDASTQSLSGKTNGVIYVAGNIEDISGTVIGRHTVTTSDTNSTTIKNNIRLDEDPRVNPDFNGVLGLVSGSIILDSSAPSNVTIQAACLAGKSGTSEGSFSYAAYDQSPTKGYIHLLGCLIQEVRGPVGTFSSSSGTLLTGYNKDYQYDTRMALRPPPYFPTTGKYRVRFWKDLH